MKKLLVCSLVAVVAALAWNVASASAHHPEVVATNVCTDGVPTIEVTAFAFTELPPDWGEDHRVNNNIRIDVEGPGADLTTSGAFAAPDYSFTVQFAVPQSVGQTLTVRVTAVAPWGPNGEYGSEDPTRETTVTVAPPCNEGTTTTTAAPTTTVTPPSTTVAPATGATTVPPAPTTAPPAANSGNTSTEVGGVVQVRPQVPTPPAGDAAAQLAFTGGNSSGLLLGGFGLVVVGLALVLSTRRREA